MKKSRWRKVAVALWAAGILGLSVESVLPMIPGVSLARTPLVVWGLGAVSFALAVTGTIWLLALLYRRDTNER